MNRTSGGTKGSRTLLARQVLSQLSYSPITNPASLGVFNRQNPSEMERISGKGPQLALVGGVWRRLRDSNPRPPA